MEDEFHSESNFPFVLFKVKGNLYCVDSRYIETLLQMPEPIMLPNSPPGIKGVFPYRGDFIAMLDMRTAFGVESLSEEFSAFAAMLDKRKDEHVEWVTELERSVYAGESFTLSHDPHACAFGKWYDNFKSDNYLINSHLKKIDEPHQNLHYAADEVDQNLKIQDPELREQHLQATLQHVKQELMPVILTLLDETKEVFHSTIFHEMVVVLNQAHLGLVVDEVLMVDTLLPPQPEDSLRTMHSSPYLAGIRRSEKVSGVILELNIPRILRDQGVESLEVL